MAFRGRAIGHSRACNVHATLQPVVLIRADAELVLAAYERWGERLMEHIDGELACAIWDRQEQRLLLGRDRFGSRPLVYAVADNRVFFASDTQAIRAVAASFRATPACCAWGWSSFPAVRCPAAAACSAMSTRHRCVPTRVRRASRSKTNPPTCAYVGSRNENRARALALRMAPRTPRSICRHPRLRRLICERHEPQSTNHEPRATSHEPRTTPRATNHEPRTTTTNHEPRTTNPTAD